MNEDILNKNFYEEMSSNVKFNRAEDLVNFLRLALSQDDTYNSSIYFAKQMSMTEGMYLQHLPNFQDDESVVFLAVSNDGSAFQFRSKRLQNNKDIAYARVKNNGIIYSSLSEELKSDIGIAKRAVSRFGEMYKFIPESLKNNHEIIVSAIQNYPYIINEMSSDIKSKYMDVFSDSVHEYESKISNKSNQGVEYGYGY